MDLKKLYKAFSYKEIKAERSGLIVLNQEQLNALHNVLLEIMEDIYLVCNENNITCTLSGGSALGGVRHKGFIPWDDDLDLNIERAELENFIEEFKKRFGDKYWIHTPQDNPKYGMTFCRIRKKGTVVKSKEDLIDDSEAGAYVDIFIIENVPNNRAARQLHGMLCIITKVCFSCRRTFRDRKWLLQTVDYEKSLRRRFRFRIIIGFLCSFMPVEKWTKYTDRIYSLCKDGNSIYVTIPAGRGHYFGEIQDRESFCSAKDIIFENQEASICVGDDQYMRRLYGENYMEMPPKNKREDHTCWTFDLDKGPNI